MNNFDYIIRYKYAEINHPMYNSTKCIIVFFFFYSTCTIFNNVENLQTPITSKQKGFCSGGAKA